MTIRLESRLQQLETERRRGIHGIETPAEFSLALGSAYFRAGQLEDAEREYREAIKASPKMGEAHNNLAVVCMMTGRHELAEAEIKAAVQEAADAAILRIARMKSLSPKMSDMELTERAREIFETAFKRAGELDITTFRVAYDAKSGGFTLATLSHFDAVVQVQIGAQPQPRSHGGAELTEQTRRRVLLVRVQRFHVRRRDRVRRKPFDQAPRNRESTDRGEPEQHRLHRYTLCFRNRTHSRVNIQVP